MQKRLWKCDGPDCTNIREQEWENFALGGDWLSYVAQTEESYVDPVDSRTRFVQFRVDFCSPRCRDAYKEQNAVT